MGVDLERKKENEEAARWVRERLTRMLPLQATNSSKKSNKIHHKNPKIFVFVFEIFFKNVDFQKFCQNTILNTRFQKYFKILKILWRINYESYSWIMKIHFKV